MNEQRTPLECWRSYVGDWSDMIGMRFADFPGIRQAGDDLAEYAATLEAKLEAMTKAAQDLLDWHDGVLGRGPALDSAKAALRKILGAQQEKEDESTDAAR